MYNNGGKRTAKKGSSAKAGPSAQLSSSTRARADPTRTVGTANAVAAGIDLSRVAIMADRELDWIRQLAYGEAAAAEVERSRGADLAARKALSDARIAHWPDTTDARQNAFLQSRADEAEEAERRRVVLDELYAQQMAEERLARLAALELQRLRDDPRGRNAKSVLMLNEAIRAREQQIAFAASVQSTEAAENEAERNRMLMDLWGYTAEELQKKITARERNMAQKNHNLEAILFQIQERQQTRHDAKADGELVRQEAAEEARENTAEAAERRARDIAIGQDNAAVARHQRSEYAKLQGRIADTANDAAEAAAQERKVAHIARGVADRQQAKLDRFEEHKRAGIDLHAAQQSRHGPTRRTQDRFENTGVSFLSQMASGDTERTKRGKDSRRLLGESERAAAAAEADEAAAGSGRCYKRAEASASGFTSMDEERAYLAEMRLAPEAMRAEAAAKAAARREAALRIEAIQKLQSAEKREQSRRAVEAERESARRQQQQQAQGDAKYTAFIEAQLPADMDSYLRAKALQLE